MSAPTRKTLVAIAVCTAVFILGVGWLFWLRFQAGDLYPPYSSLRGDPLGTQVLFESVQALTHGKAQRHFRPLDQLVLTADTTFLVSGVTGRAPFLEMAGWQRLLQQLEEGGGRLVVTLVPPGSVLREDPGAHTAPSDAAETTAQTDGTDSDAAAGDDVTPSAPVQSDNDTHLLDLLGLSLLPAPSGDLDDFAVRAGGAPATLPDRIPWRAPQHFAPDHPDWQVIYRWHDRPVMLQRTWGRGTVVLAGDSYLLSNEALREHRYSALLTWWLQLPNLLVVDEFHLGLAKQPGIAGLMRKFRLQAPAAALLLLALLIIWRHAAPLVPEPPAPPADRVQSAIDQGAQDGWIALMQRHVAVADLIAVCHAAWRAGPAIHRIPEERVARVAALLEQTDAATRRKDPVGLYRRICQLLKQGNPQ
ncbi:DUF4350 domain-containing protein [Desulfatitalea alkaliphila]|uniref:DUF4350 domain-containing protein n=1 Tax=Desulfatitalea alkaliphila TaxID=2929485 RepID=A0AA41R6L4_9BACT|nr:DUF4350 domain-containing protein [Desulfatitalea alkaliphila]MCJ8502671.1 hypothetical protein [Desulfatitalea alkaliphila]